MLGLFDRKVINTGISKNLSCAKNPGCICSKKEELSFHIKNSKRIPYDDAKAGAAVAVQSFGLRLRFQPGG